MLRVIVGIVFIAHGYNHIFGGGKIAGTGRWFESLGRSGAGCTRGRRASPNWAPAAC